MIEKLFHILFIAMLPVSELRGAIPLGIWHFKVAWYITVPVAILGNLIPVFPILYFLEFIKRIMSKWNFTRRIIYFFYHRAEKKDRLIKKYGFIGLVLFVAIPFPTTGAWTGSLIAHILGLPPIRSFFAVSIGVIFAAVIVTTLSLLGWIGAFIGGVLLLSFTIISIIRKD